MTVHTEVAAPGRGRPTKELTLEQESTENNTTTTGTVGSGISRVLSRRDVALSWGDGGFFDSAPVTSLVTVMAKLQELQDAAGKKIPKYPARGSISRSFQFEVQTAEDVYMLWTDLRDLVSGELARRTGETI